MPAPETTDDAELAKGCAELVSMLANLADEAATTSEGARAFIALVNAGKALPQQRARRLREFCQCMAFELRGIA